MKKYIAEMIGTMVLVLMGCGSAVFAGSMAGTVGKGLFYAILASVLWAIVNPFIKQGLSYDFSPMNFAGIRFTTVGIRLFFMPWGPPVGTTDRRLPVPTALVTARCYRHSSQKWSLLSFLYW